MRFYVYTLYLDCGIENVVTMCSPYSIDEVIEDQIRSLAPFIKLVDLEGSICYINIEHVVWYARDYDTESCQDEQIPQDYEYNVDPIVRKKYRWQFERISNALEHNTKLHKEYYGED